MTAGKKPDKIGLSGFPAPCKSNASPGSCGYVHSADTGLYYLQSRYYNPKIGRFLNADMYASTGQGFVGNNMFAYCLNNPVAYGDSQGTVAKICLTADGRIEDSPWRNHSPGGGGFVYHCDNITTQYDGDKFLTQIALRHIGNFFEALWEAHVLSIELQMQQQYQQDMAVRAHFQQSFSSPENTAKTLDRYGWYLEGSAIVIGMTGHPIVGGIVGLLGWGLKGVSAVILENA